ncbi:hypothetical protein FQN54_009591 [Arachnomyces sp. PD_36]|nr:hypothetical protein FQN54_009591 [Arachnomyces sp. PD_36]
MAVLSKFEATVRVNGKPSTEYDAEEDDEQPDNTVVKYIEAISDAEVSFHFKLHPGFKADCDFIQWDILIDGQWITAPVMKKNEFPKARCSKPAKMESFGVLSGGGNTWVERKYKFSNISFRHSSDEDKSNTKVAPDIGTLRIKAWPSRLIRKEARAIGDKFVPQGGVSEKSAKGQAVSHAVSLATAQAVDRTQKTWVGKGIDTEPVAVFVFRYRSKKALQDLMIIPRSPSPPPPPEERPVDQLSEEEVREQLRRLRAKESANAEAQAKVKREREEEPNSVNSLQPNKRAREDPGESQAGADGCEIEYTFSRSVKQVASEPIDLTED